MGSGWRRGQSSVASCELYVDKVVKCIPGFLQLVLGLAIIVLAHGIDVACDEYKTFSFLVLCQAISLILSLLLWFWCYGQDLANHVQELIHHVNHLTNQYKRYSDGMNRGGGHREVMAGTLHCDLDNYLEYLLHVLIVKGRKLYSRHFLKWIVILVISFLWLIGFVVIVVQCGLPVQLYLKVLWIIPIITLAGTIVVVVFHIVYDLSLPQNYESTFFYQAVPGAMDARLARIISETYNPRYVWLLSRHCWQNAGLCVNAGLSKSLARKYCYISLQHRQDRWRDQHFPTLRSDQVEKFQFSANQYAQGRFHDQAGCCESMLWCGLDKPHHASNYGDHSPRHTGQLAKAIKRAGSRRNWNLSGRHQVGAGRGKYQPDDDASSGSRPTMHMIAEDGYMTPNLFVRKLARESATPEQLLDEEDARKPKREKASRPPRDDLNVPSIGPQRFPVGHQGPASGKLGLSRDDTEVDYGAFYHPHNPDPHRMQREYDPLTYGVRMSVKKEMAKDVKVWRP